MKVLLPAQILKRSIARVFCHPLINVNTCYILLAQTLCVGFCLSNLDDRCKKEKYESFIGS